MAHKPENLTRGVAGSVNYPNGDVADNPNGTLVNRQMLTDVLQTMQRAMILGGITPNGLDDNVANTYQVSEALGLEAWTDAGTTLTVTPFSGTVTIDPGDVIYNRYKIVGHTLYWQLQIRTVTISGTSGGFFIGLPSALTGKQFVNSNYRFVKLYEDGTTFKDLAVILGNNSGTGRIGCAVLGGANLTNGSNQAFDIDIVAEIV